MITAVFTAVLWTAAQIPVWWRAIFPTVGIAAVAANSFDGAVLYNTGRVAIFVHQIMFFSTGSQWSAQGIPIDEMLQPGKFLKVSSPAKAFEGEWVRNTSPVMLERLMNLAANQREGKDCARIAHFAKNDPLWLNLSHSAGPTLNTISAGGYVEYVSTQAPQTTIKAPIDSIAAIMESHKPGCPSGE